MIRSATIQDIEPLYELIMIILNDMELEILKEIPATTFKSMLIEAMHHEAFRSHPNKAIVYEVDGQVAGALFHYPGDIEPFMDQPFMDLYEKYQVTTTLPLFVDKETAPGEEYIETVVVHPNFRNRGIAKSLLHHLFENAPTGTELTLNCETDNTIAFHLYSSLGFVPKSTRTLSGHSYWHMHKLI